MSLYFFEKISKLFVEDKHTQINQYLNNKSIASINSTLIETKEILFALIK